MTKFNPPDNFLSLLNSQVYGPSTQIIASDVSIYCTGSIVNAHEINTMRFIKLIINYMYIHVHVHEKTHGVARQASNPWTVAVSSILAPFSSMTCLAHHPALYTCTQSEHVHCTCKFNIIGLRTLCNLWSCGSLMYSQCTYSCTCTRVLTCTCSGL